jgi:pilus assembly protein Flp/PilA
MEKLLTATGNFLRDEEGVTAIEYGLIAALIAVAIIAAVTVVGKQLCATFNTIAVKLGGTAATCPT